MKRFTEEFKQKLEREIEGLEAQTSVEIVPRFVEASDAYETYKLWMATNFALVGAVLSILFVNDRIFALAIVVSVLLLGRFLFSFPKIFSFFLSSAYADSKVEKKAFEIFLKDELFKTQKRNAILVLVSQLEKSVFVLGDIGFESVIPSNCFSEIARDLAKDFNHQVPGDSFFSAFKKFEEKIIASFPPDSNNPNEIDNRLK